MKLMRRRWLLSAIAAGSMFTAVGCESVGGVDLNKAIVSTYDVQSSEGTMRLEWNIAGTPEGDSEAERMLKLFGSGAIVVTEALQQDMHTASMAGELELPVGNIPFELYMDEETMIIDVEGAKQPYAIDLTSPETDAEAAAMLPFDPAKLSEPAVQGAIQEAFRSLAGYVVGHVPNPENTALGSSTETIDGKSKKLTKVTMEAGFDELPGMLQEALESIAADEEGLKTLLGSMYDVLKPAIDELVDEDSIDPTTQQMIENKTLLVELAYTTIAPALQSFAEELSNADTSGLPFSEDSGVTFEYLLDGTKPAGMNVGLYFAPAEGEGDGFESMAIDVESRWWNVNGDVEAKTYDGDTVDFPAEAKPRDRLDNLDESSLLYDILKNELHVTRHSFNMYMGENASVPDGVSPYIKGAGTTMVPVRYVSEQLDAAVGWNPETETITIEDAEEGTKIVMTVGSTTATVNGEAVEMPEAAEIVHESTFVPIAFITEALGGKADWDGSIGTVTITKEF